MPKNPQKSAKYRYELMIVTHYAFTLLRVCGCASYRVNQEPLTNVNS